MTQVYTLKRDTYGWNTVWITVNGKAFLVNDVYLMIKRRDDAPRGYYSVKGIVGFGGMGYAGPISTQRLVKGLQRLGIDITAHGLRELFKTPTRAL